MHGIDELTSWRDTATRRAILDFVDAVTGDESPDWLAPAERIAVFDNDGTLWPEKPMLAQLDFTLRRFSALAEASPSLREQQPYKAAWSGDGSWLQDAMLKHYNGDDADMAILLREVPAAFAGMTIEAYLAEAEAFVTEAAHPRFGVPYAGLAYVPMQELLRFLEANSFTIYIASGGERDFMRAFAESMYNIPPERIIGSSLKLAFEEQEDSVRIVYRPEMHVFDDGEEKPKNIWGRIGRRPIVAGGNSNGDIAMMRFANAPGRRSLRLLVRHDDPEREYADDRGAEVALTRANERNWTVISMRSDWSRVFAHDSMVETPGHSR